jgi:hypothetical protein
MSFRIYHLSRVFICATSFIISLLIRVFLLRDEAAPTPLRPMIDEPELESVVGINLDSSCG